MPKIRSIARSANRRSVPFKYCSRDVDRHGNERFYIRIPDRPKHRMHALFLDDKGSVTKEFTDEYHRVIAGDIQQTTQRTRPNALEPGTIGWLLANYYRSKAFLAQAPETQKDKRSVLGRYCDNVGHLPYKKLRKSDIEASQMKRAETPAAADKLVKYLKAMFSWAMSADLATLNPAAGIGKIHSSSGFHSWTEIEVRKFRHAYPVGTMARLALELMINLGIRRSDVVKLGPANIIEGRIEFVPVKGARRNRAVLSLPITDELTEVLSATKRRHETFLVTEFGKAFTSNGFGNKMRQWCDEIGLPNCSSHGLRKASATILAEAGATEHQLMAIFGWSDSKMAQHYTKEAQAKKIIDAGFERRKAHADRKIVPLSQPEISSGVTKGEKHVPTMPIQGIGGPGRTRTSNQTVMSGQL